MPSLNTEPLDGVLSQYDIQVSGIRNESYKDKKGVWRVSTASGEKILKKMSASENTLKYLLAAVEHLNAHGVHIPAVLRTKTGIPYGVVDGACFILSEAVEGRNPRYDSPEELKRVVQELALFHRASMGFVPPPDSKPKCHLGTWPEDYDRQVEDLRTYYQDAGFIQRSGAVGALIEKEFSGMYRRALTALEGLKGPEYAEWVKKAEAAGGLCHQDFAAGNLILDRNGTLFVLDIDSVTQDIPARDIRKLLNKIMKKKGRWDLETAQKILAHYQQVNPLTPSEWRVVRLDLTFPHLFLGAMNKYCYQRDREWDEGKYHQRLKEMDAFEKTLPPVLDNFDRIIPIL